jgi:hypothetical protein
MKVSSIVDYLVNGDLRQTALSDIGIDGSRNEKQVNNLNTLLGFCNQGLLELYKRFPISANIEDVFVLKPSTTEDLIELPDSSMALIKVTDQLGEETPVDDYNIDYQFKNKIYTGVYVKSLAINKYLVLGNVPITGVSLQFHYTTAPDTVRYTSTLPLPAIFQEALMLYMAYRGYSTIKSVSEVGDEGMIYRKKFEDSCNKITEYTDTLFEWANPSRLRQRGFV